MYLQIFSLGDFEITTMFAAASVPFISSGKFFTLRNITEWEKFWLTINWCNGGENALLV